MSKAFHEDNDTGAIYAAIHHSEFLQKLIHSEGVEKELNALIERRALKATGEQQFIEDAWAESARVHQRRTRERNRWEWIRFFERMARSHAAMSEGYEQRVAELLEGAPGITHDKEGDAA